MSGKSITDNIMTKTKNITRARLGHVTPYGWPRSVYKSDVELRFMSRNGQTTLKVMGNDPHFQYQLNKSQDAYLVQIW